MIFYRYIKGNPFPIILGHTPLDYLFLRIKTFLGNLLITFFTDLIGIYQIVENIGGYAYYIPLKFGPY
jgi:hypothetical protein